MNFTIHDLHAQLVNKEISAVELTKKVIAHRDSVEKDVHSQSHYLINFQK